MPSRYGTGELYGFDFSALAPEQIRELSSAQHKSMLRPFKQVSPDKPVPKCNKKGGVCSLRQFVQREQGVVEATGEPVRRVRIVSWRQTSLPNGSAKLFWELRVRP